VKLDENKTTDALQKLIDYDDKLDLLFAAPNPR
jgi:hypothetical protein